VSGRSLRWCSAAAAALVATISALPSVAEEPLVTDRPDFTESALVVDPGRWQVEMGTTYDDGASVEALTVGEMLIRWGFARDLELRVFPLSYLWTDDEGDDSSGLLDATVGLKYEIQDGSGAGLWGSTALAVIVSTTVPTGGSAVSSDDWQPAAVVAASWPLAPAWSLASNLGYARPSDGEQRFNSVWASLSLGVGLGDRTGMFVELYGFEREEARGPNTMAFQTGVTHRLNPNLQLDARVARRLTDDGPDLLIGAGASWRY
jgi:hypothetical protein